MASASRCDAYSRVAHTERVVGITSAVGTSRSCSRHTNKSEENLGVGFFGSPVRRNYHSKGVLVFLVIRVKNQSVFLLTYLIHRSTFGTRLFVAGRRFRGGGISTSGAKPWLWFAKL